MLRNSIILVALLIAVVKSPVYADSNTTFLDRAAGKLIGEGGQLGDDFPLLACTLRNRLDRGWVKSKVLGHYDGKYHHPTQAHIDELSRILNADKSELSEYCNRVYFFWATWYIEKWACRGVIPVIELGGHRYYTYEQYYDLWESC